MKVKLINQSFCSEQFLVSEVVRVFFSGEVRIGFIFYSVKVYF